MIIFLILVLSVPGTAVTIGFNSMFADLVPVAWRGYVAGIRNSLLAAASTFNHIAKRLDFSRSTFSIGLSNCIWTWFYWGDAEQPVFVLDCR